MANPSLQIGNSNWAIKEDDLLGYSTVGTNYLPKPMTMTRESAGTRVNPQGLIETVELLGSENIDLSSFVSATNWAINGSEIEASGTTALFKQPFTLGAGKTFKITIVVDSLSSGNFEFWVGGYSNDTPTISSADTYTYYVTSGGSELYMGFNPHSNLIATISSISVKESTKNNLARVDYDGTASSLLVEPERTNLVTYSEDFSQTKWTGNPTTADVTVTTNTNPSGASGTYSVENVTGTQLGSFYTITSGVDYTNSFYVRNISGSGAITLKDINNSGTAFTATSEWQKFSVTGTSNSTTGRIYLNVTTVGDIVEVWGAQLEQGSYATSYIPTDGGTVTRVKDQYSKTGISNLINSEEGSFFVDISALNASPGSQLSISLSGDNSNDRVLIYTGSGGGEWICQFRKDSTTIVTVKRNTTVTNQSKVAVSWKSGKYLMYIDGDKATTYSVGSETEATTFDVGDLKNLQFSPNHNSTSNLFYGKVKQLQVFKTALTDPELVTLTT